MNTKELEKRCNELFFQVNEKTERIAELEKENAELKADNDARKFAMAMSEKVEKQLREENTDLKVRIGLSIDCEKAQKNGEFCLGYGGDEDEPCERCKNCIKCESGYYQLGEVPTEFLNKDDRMINEVFGRDEIENKLDTEKLHELFSKINIEDIMKTKKPKIKRIIDFEELDCVIKNKI